ncbi:MAG: hypothetical protein GQF41_3641 [Candidatus Rifleibacterium amylolyticum]|nr:MAG: hypothetical protein GQF41_3641 [Candidatus Rifleibacterium amylolyticum]
MTALIAYSVLLKVFHFWHVIGKDVGGSLLPNFQYIVATLALLLMSFLALRTINSNSLRFWLAFTLNLALGLFFHVSYMYYRMFAAPLDYSLLLVVRNATEVGDSALNLFRLSDLFLYSLDILIIISYLHSGTRNRLTLTENFLIKIPAKKVMIALVLLLVSWYGSFYPLKRWTQPFEQRGLYAIASYGPAGYVVSETIREVYRIVSPPEIDDATASQIHQKLLELAEKRQVLTIPFAKESTARNIYPDVFIIQVETLMKDFLFNDFNGIVVMPVLRDLASKSVFLENFYSHAVSTADSDFSTLTSLLPLKLAIAHMRYAENRFASLPKELNHYGYFNIYGVGGPKHFWNVERFNSNIGFDRVFALEDWGDSQKIGPWTSDEALLSNLLKKTADCPRPLFCMVHLSSAHHPFTLSGLPQTISNKGYEGAELELANHANAINYADQAIGMFIKSLDAMGRLQNSIIVVYGDHPVMLQVQKERLSKKYGKLPGSEDLMRFLNSNVPCMIYAPGLLKPQIITKYCGQIDLAPTILSILGKTQPLRFLGTSVFSEGEGVALHKYECGRNSELIFYQGLISNDDATGFRHVINANTLENATNSHEVSIYYSMFKLSNKIIEYDYHE